MIEQSFNSFDWAVMALLGLDDLPTDYNPITQALKDDSEFVQKVCQVKKACKDSLARLVVLCQTQVFNRIGGPDRDGRRKGLRRHWYAYFKSDFAQPFSEQLGEDLQEENWGRSWAARLSQVCKDLVDNDGFTYWDLWVSDISRMMTTSNEPLFSGCNIILAVEKDSEFGDFDDVAKRLGARALYSGKGKSSCAAIEKLLMDAFDWSDYNDPFSEDDPLYVIHISDYDYDGEAVIGPTFAEQARRYTSHIKEARIGINPDQVLLAGYDYADKWYQISLSNSAAKQWAEEKAIEGKYGFEVEALGMPDYYPFIVDTLLTLMDFDEAVERLRDECEPDEYEAAKAALDTFLDGNREYQELLTRLQTYKQAIFDHLYKQAYQDADEVPPPYGDPMPDDYKDHVVSPGEQPWRPFSQEQQTQALTEILLDKYSEELKQIKLED